jgi:hypothetical protein
MLEAVHRAVGDHPQHVLADAGFRSEVVLQFSMRGLAKAQAEWQLVCAALNLRRMARLVPV